MSTIEKQQQGKEFLNSLVEKSWTDNTFKKQLIENPISTIEGITGRSFVMPENKNLVFEDQTDESIIYLNIPKNADADGLELTEEQLEQVAGGTSPWCAVAAGIAIADAVYNFCDGFAHGGASR